MNTLRALFKARLLRGVLEGSRMWLVLGAVVAVKRLAERGRPQGPDLIFREELHRGQSFLITHLAERGPNGRAAEPR